MTPRETYLLRLRRQRQAEGWTQAEVAEALGVSFQSVCGWELGRKQPPASRVRAWAELLGVPFPPQGMFPSPLKPCPSHAAYQRHRRNGERCPPCWEAHSAHNIAARRREQIGVRRAG